MPFQADSLGLAGGVTAILADLIHDRLGLRYDASQLDQVADRLAPLVVARGLGSFMDYYYILKYSEDSEEWGRVMDALAINETYFWREIDQLRAVVEHIVPEVVERTGGRPLRIWSVPCATGEEPLTIAMLLDERGWFERAPIEIVGSDASPGAVGRARAGVYGTRAFRNLSPALRERYFSQTDERTWTVSPSLHNRVRFDIVNLMDADAVALHARVPIICCRNVFIYFSDRSIRRAVDVFARSMTDPGVLCVGASESLLRLATRFDLREIGGAFMYVRDGASDRAPFAVAVRSERT